MTIKDFTTNNLELIMNMIIRELIERNISYVRVDNELHFDNHIFRFHEKREYEVNLIAVPNSVYEYFNEYDSISKLEHSNEYNILPRGEYFKITSSSKNTPKPLYHQNKQLQIYQ